jgi:signal transduction histidine kinase
LDIDLMVELVTQVELAIQQAELYQQVQLLNSELACQVDLRTAELQIALQFESLLKRITDKVRDSLDEAHILQTAVDELAAGLPIQVCDVAIYTLKQRFSTIRYESIDSGVPSGVGQTVSMDQNCEVYQQLLQGQYVLFNTIQPVELTPRSVEHDYTILACPIQNEQEVIGDLWLFKKLPDSFTSLEIRLVQQVANQCGIALRQSHLYQAAQTQIQQLQRLNQLKDDFISTVSHELRTPLSSMKLAIHLLTLSQKQDPFTPKQQQYLQMLEQECSREIALVNDILDFTKLENKTYELRLSTIELASWLSNLCSSFALHAQTQQQDFVLSPVDPSLCLRTDSTCLTRILSELLNNACKYTDQGGQIQIKALFQDPELESEDRSGILFTVNNTAHIPEQELSHLFDKFYRVPQADRWQRGGTGLGLALVEQMVQVLQGQIQVTSQNGWTSFRIWIPNMGPYPLRSAAADRYKLAR